MAPRLSWFATLQFRDEVDDQLPVWAHRILQGAAPLTHLPFTLHEDLTDQGLEGLCEGCIRDVTLVLVEFARCECSSFTTEDLPTPEKPDTNTSSGVPWATTRPKAASRALTSPSRPYCFSGISNRSGTSCVPTETGRCGPVFPIPTGTAEDHPRDPWRSGSGPRLS
jgi:hypothetical protein